MPAFNDTSFQDRVASAAKAKQKALDQLKARPPVDPAILAERRTALEAREQVLANERAAKAQALADAKAKKARSDAAAIEEAEAAAALRAPRPEPSTEAERKAARDARYAARKARRK